MESFRERTAHQKNVDSFMQLAEQELPEKPVIPDESVRKLRASLMLEETLETIASMGVNVSVTDQWGNTASIVTSAAGPLPAATFDFTARGVPDIIGVADGCADVRVVTTGTLSAFGIPDSELQDIVDSNNLEKFGNGNVKNAEGKVLKPEGFVGPGEKIRELINRLSE